MEDMVRFESIKLIIWDLDETLWKGTISEEQVLIPGEISALLRDLTDCGVMSSICSKNDSAVARKRLEEEGLWDLFVFPSINWDPKGSRTRQLIENMQLRAANVLFLDDNPQNLEEVRYFNPEIMTAGPDLIPRLAEHFRKAERKDPDHKRLHQYRILEEKHQAKEQYESNEEFLLKSDIRVDISKDCAEHADRIHDLILRSNQLNFTKVRSSLQELEDLFESPDADCGYVSVRDRYGDYGITGFYALKGKDLLHFTFSCRILGMGVEQYVYNLLGRPDLTVAGEVISDLSGEELPAWINQEKRYASEQKMQIRNLKEHTVLVKGPCDLFQVYPYIAQTELFDTEFTYTTDSGLTIESTGHTTHIVESLRLSEEEKQRVLTEVPFTDKGIYSDRIFRNHYKVVFLSILVDANLGVYQRKGTGEKLAFLEYIHPITDPSNWEAYIKGRYNCGGFAFTEKILRDFAEKYEFIGRNTPETTAGNIAFIRDHLPKDCLLVIMLGGELYYEKNEFEAYRDRHLVHKKMNDLLRLYANGRDDVRLMDVNKYLVDQTSFYDHFNHYIKPVYYSLAGEMTEIINDFTGSQIRETGKWKMLQIRLKEMLAPSYYKLRKLVRGAGKNGKGIRW